MNLYQILLISQLRRLYGKFDQKALLLNQVEMSLRTEVVWMFKQLFLMQQDQTLILNAKDSLRLCLGKPKSPQNPIPQIPKQMAVESLLKLEPKFILQFRVLLCAYDKTDTSPDEFAPNLLRLSPWKND